MSVLDLLNPATGNHAHWRGHNGSGSNTSEQAAGEVVIGSVAKFSSTTNISGNGNYDSSAGVSAPFTLTAIDGEGLSKLTLRLLADQAGTLDISISDDGVTWDVVPNTACDTAIGLTTSASHTGTTTANTLVFVVMRLYAQYVKVKWTNGATPTTVFRITGRVGSS